MKYVLIHGSFSTPHDAWFPWLKKQLEQAGHEVIAPQFPVDVWQEVVNLDLSEYRPKQNLTVWLQTFAAMKNLILNETDLNFVGHSLGPLFILHLVEKYHIPLVSAYFVAPFFEIYEKEPIVEKTNATFYKTDFDFGKLRRFIPRSTVFYSDDDPYVEVKKSLDFARKLGSSVVVLKGLGHMGLESKMTKFPVLLEKILA